MAGRDRDRAGNRRRSLVCAAVAVIALLALPSIASADYEQAPEHFGTVGEVNTRLEGAEGLAVNSSGVGLPAGEAGSFYVAATGVLHRTVLRFSAGTEGEEPQFLEAWGWGVGDRAQEYERCGPALTTEPAEDTFHTCLPESGAFPGEQIGNFGAPGAIAVDPTTGYVYVLTAASPGHRERNLIEIFTATGTPVGRFGDLADRSESIAESPEKLHEQEYERGIAVDAAGTVYVEDREGISNGESRVAIFEPCTAGNYESYCYVDGKDITTEASGASRFTRVAVVGNDRVVAASLSLIRVYPTSGGDAPICSYKVPGGGLWAMTADPATGEIFYASEKDEEVHRLSPCNEANGNIEPLQGAMSVSPAAGRIQALALNPGLSWSPLRPAGVLYAVDALRHQSAIPEIHGIGDIFVQAASTPPSILSESAANTTATSSTLKASIDPHGFGTHYVFQYLSQEAYEANEPNERQSVTVSATGGVFGLGFGERGLGGAATADLASGSSAATGLITAKGTADVHVGAGTATLTSVAGTANATKGSATLTEVTTATGAGLLSFGEGRGNLAGGSKTVEGVVTEEGAFAVGQLISGTGLAANTTITAVGAGTLQLSTAASGSGTAVVLQAASKKVTAVSTTSGEFVSGQTIVGADIPNETKITAVGPETLTLSALPTGNGPEALRAGAAPVRSGQFVTGPGIPTGTTVLSVGPRNLVLSKEPTESGAQINFRAASNVLKEVTTTEGAFEVGEAITGKGIPSGTTIVEANPPELVLSGPVDEAGSSVAIGAASTALTGVATTEGRFEPGTPIVGEGIPAGTTVTAVGSGTIRISTAPTKPGAGVAISSSGPAPLAAGEILEGPGLAPGTTIVAAKAGELMLSRPATASQASARVRAGLPFDASAAEVQRALEALPMIGKGDVKASGGPGDATGASPYEIEFTGFPNQDVPELEADASGLTGGAASATVATTNQGGGGFAHGASEAPVGGGEIPGTGVGAASVGISGLSPDTQYRFRVVIASQCLGSTQPACEVDGAPVGFTTFPEASATLADGRTYELVSPTAKNGGEVIPAQPSVGSCDRHECKPPGADIPEEFTPMQSAPDGDTLAYMGQPFSASEGGAVFDSYISVRGARGWQTKTMTQEPGGQVLTYDDQLGEGLLRGGGNAQSATEAPAGYEDLFVQSAANPAALAPLLTRAMFEALPGHEPRPPHRGPGQLKLTYGGHSGDYSAQYFTANDALTEGTAYAPEPPDPGFEGQDLYEWRDGRVALVNVLPGNGSVANGAAFASAVSPDIHGVSENGSRVFWTAAGHLYMREDNRTTREIHHPGSFVTASPDGLEVLLSDGCLYSLTTTRCGADLTQGKGGFLGVAGQDEGLSRIYFVDTATLPGENERKEEAVAGMPNLYLFEAGSGTTFIATLGPTEGGQSGSESRNTINDWIDVPGRRTAEASRDGRYLAFASAKPLTGFDNVGPCGAGAPTAGGGFEVIEAACNEVFLYDSVTGRLSCASCSPTGEAPLGGSVLRRLENSTPWLPQPRYLTDSGRLFFDSQDRLSPSDSNGRVEDVYELEPQGSGSCERPSGCRELITPGSGSVDSNLLAVDESGANVFFTTRERLVQKDTDELLDVYDAREGGGFPGETETQRPECQGESCQPVAQAPDDPTPASSAFHGAGNVTEPAPAKKQPRRHKQHRKHKHKKAKKGRHGKMKQGKKKAKGRKRAAGHDRGGAK